jgi:hypothetical protein
MENYDDLDFELFDVELLNFDFEIPDFKDLEEAIDELAAIDVDLNDFDDIVLTDFEILDFKDLEEAIDRLADLEIDI